MADRREYDSFVVECSPRLLRVAYLLSGDWAAAEDFLQSVEHAERDTLWRALRELPRRRRCPAGRSASAPAPT